MASFTNGYLASSSLIEELCSDSNKIDIFRSKQNSNNNPDQSKKYIFELWEDLLIILGECDFENARWWLTQTVDIPYQDGYWVRFLSESNVKKVAEWLEGAEYKKLMEVGLSKMLTSSGTRTLMTEPHYRHVIGDIQGIIRFFEKATKESYCVLFISGGF